MAKRKELETKKETSFTPEDEIVIKLLLELPYEDQREVKGYIRCLADCNLMKHQDQEPA